jgi:hypothetical protein
MLRPTAQSASSSWNKAPIWGVRPDLYYCQTAAGLLIWGALSDERTGLSFARLSYTSLFVSSASHSLKLILCRLEREYFLAPFNFLISGSTTASVFVTTESHCYGFRLRGNDLLDTRFRSSGSWGIHFRRN